MQTADSEAQIPSPIWAAEKLVRGETLFFLSSAGAQPVADLLYPIVEITAVYNRVTGKKFVPGRDFSWQPGERSVRLAPGSEIPFCTEADIYPDPQGASLFPAADANAIAGRTGCENGLLLFDRRDRFARLQAEVDYLCRHDWNGPRPAPQQEKLPRCRKKLAARETLKVASIGDSITEGHNATGLMHMPPFEPPYIERFARDLGKFYCAKVELKNLAVAGTGCQEAPVKVELLKGAEPDLLVIAYGMNNLFGTPAAEFRAAVVAAMARARELNPEIEFILVSSMLGNSEWVRTPAEPLELFRAELAGLAAQSESVALADVTGVWQALLGRKNYLDLTGNGVNHPNDFGHQVYASVLEAIFF